MQPGRSVRIDDWFRRMYRIFSQMGTSAPCSGRFRWLIVLWLIASITPAIAEEGQPVLIPHARQYDFVSKINGQRYRLFIRVPPEAAPRGGYPVFYVLDGNYYFGTVSDEAQRLIHQKRVVPFIVVGIGLPTRSQGESAAAKWVFQAFGNLPR